MSTFVVVISILAAVSIAAFLVFRPSKAAPIGLAVASFGVAAFSAFGFLASFEPSETGSNLGFKIVYAGTFLASLLGLYRSGRRLLLPEA